MRHDPDDLSKYYTSFVSKGYSPLDLPMSILK